MADDAEHRPIPLERPGGKRPRQAQSSDGDNMIAGPKPSSGPVSCETVLTGLVAAACAAEVQTPTVSGPSTIEGLGPTKNVFFVSDENYAPLAQLVPTLLFDIVMHEPALADKKVQTVARSTFHKYSDYPKKAEDEPANALDPVVSPSGESPLQSGVWRYDGSRIHPRRGTLAACHEKDDGYCLGAINVLPMSEAHAELGPQDVDSCGSAFAVKRSVWQHGAAARDNELALCVRLNDSVGLGGARSFGANEEKKRMRRSEQVVAAVAGVSGPALGSHMSGLEILVVVPSHMMDDQIVDGRNMQVPLPYEFDDLHTAGHLRQARGLFSHQRGLAETASLFGRRLDGDGTHIAARKGAVSGSDLAKLNLVDTSKVLPEHLCDGNPVFSELSLPSFHFEQEIALVGLEKRNVKVIPGAGIYEERSVEHRVQLSERSSFATVENLSERHHICGDRPFLVLVRELATSNIVFAGVVSRPGGDDKNKPSRSTSPELPKDAAEEIRGASEPNRTNIALAKCEFGPSFPSNLDM